MRVPMTPEPIDVMVDIVLSRSEWKIYETALSQEEDVYSERLGEKINRHVEGVHDENSPVFITLTRKDIESIVYLGVKIVKRVFESQNSD